MPKSVFSAWVKNVYSLLIQEGTNGVHLPTTQTFSTYFSTKPVHKLLSLPRFIPAFPLQLSTQKITQIPLLNSYLYPLSTPPINMKTKGNIERNT